MRCPTTFLRKGRCVTTSIAGVVVDCGSKFTTPCGDRFGSRSAKILSRAPVASTAKPSRQPGPVAHGDTTRGKKINGVKRHILVDTLGLVLAVVVHSAKIQDRDGAKLVFARAGEGERAVAEAGTCLGRWRLCREV